MWTWVDPAKTKIREVKEEEYLKYRKHEAIWKKLEIYEKKIELLLKLIEECGIGHKIENTEKN